MWVIKTVTVLVGLFIIWLPLSFTFPEWTPAQQWAMAAILYLLWMDARQ